MHKEAEEELIRSGIVTGDQLHAAKEKSRTNRQSILLNLLEGRSAESCRAITESLAQHYKIPMLSMKKIVPPQEIMSMCNAKQARKLHFLPVAMHGNQIVVGMVDPLDLNLSDEIRAIFRRTVQPVFISLDDFEHNYYRFFRKGVSLPGENPNLMNTAALKKAFLDSDETDLPDNVKEIISKKFAAKIVSIALASNASGFSVEPQQDVCLVNITIDGTEYNLYRFSISNHKAMVDAMMRLAKLDPSEHKGVDQFSRCQVKFRDRNFILVYGFRHSPTGDRVVVHIIDPAIASMEIAQLGLSQREQQKLEKTMEGGGIIIVTGPNGSGKSTLLQTMTRDAVAKGKSTYTIEDVVGLKIDGARQLQTKPDGPSKAQILAALRKKGAEVIVVDEIDKESLSAAVECAEAGILMLLSVTAPDIGEALSRVMRSGVSRADFAPLLKSACTHKVIRQLCPDCKSGSTLHSTTMAQWQMPDNIQFQTSSGCGSCENTGFRGTINLTELFDVSEKIAEMIRQGASGPELVQQARYEGMLRLIEKGMNKAIDGSTSVEEVLASIPFNMPFPVREQMRMGRVMPPKKAEEGAKASPSKEPQPPFGNEKKASGETIIFPGSAKAKEKKEKAPQIIKEAEKSVEEPPITAPQAAPEGTQDDKANILLVDDSPVSLEFTKHILQVSGFFNVDSANSAAEALEMLPTKQYHLVITDQEMPGQTGQEFIESIRQHPSLNNVGTILLTGNLNEMAALGGGADGYIGKPTDPEMLIARAKSIADIYKRLSAPTQARQPSPASIQPSGKATPAAGKVDFTEKDMANISNFELDMAIPAETPNPSAEEASAEAANENDDGNDINEFENLFK